MADPRLTSMTSQRQDLDPGVIVLPVLVMRFTGDQMTFSKVTKTMSASD